MVFADALRADRGDLQVIDTREGLDAAITALAAGHGPVAIDTERASSYRYSDRAYLVQLYRRGSGSFLIDPLPFDDLRDVAEAIASTQWVLHAATQDLPSMRELGLDPQDLFDTELAARLLGMERVGLGAVVKELLDIDLAKAHSADDWSQRPLPVSWLAYAALDVELLVDVRDKLADLLVDAGKADWARAEFDDVLQRDLGPRPLADRWRRMSGIHQLRSPKQLAVARSLWFARDALARETDTAPGRLVPDRSLSAVARLLPRTRGQLAGFDKFTGKASRTELDRWWQAVTEGVNDPQPPQREHSGSAVPHPKNWERKRPEAHLRLQVAKPAIADTAERLRLPTENLLTPSLLRQVAWDGTASTTAEVANELAGLGAREWQIEITAPIIAEAFAASLREPRPID